MRFAQWILIFFGGISLICGIGGFFFISSEADKWADRRDAVESGSIEALEGTVSNKRIRSSSTGSGASRTTSRDYVIHIKVEGEKPTQRMVNEDTYQSISKGQSFPVYPIDDVYFIPEFDSRDNSSVKWIVLIISSLPSLAGILIFLLRRFGLFSQH